VLNFIDDAPELGTSQTSYSKDVVCVQIFGL
jgi:hypothetical protein